MSKPRRSQDEALSKPCRQRDAERRFDAPAAQLGGQIKSTLDQLFTHGPHSGLRSVVDVQLPQDILHVLFHRLDADSQ